MTDLESTTAVIILPADTVDEAHTRMIQRGVRLLLVVDENRNVLGIVTATDILGEKPVQVAVQRGTGRGEIQVRDIMTPQERIEVLDLAALRGAKVGARRCDALQGRPAARSGGGARPAWRANGAGTFFRQPRLRGNWA
jgi:hypothetical protein